MNRNKQLVPDDARPQAQEEQLAAALQAAYPAAEVSPQLQRRVSEMAAAHEKRVSQRRVVRGRLRAANGLAFASLLLVVFVGLWPRIALARVLAQVDAAMSGVNSAHIVQWGVNPDGSRSKQTETWYQNGRWRMESWPLKETGQTRRTQVFTKGRLWEYEPELQKVTVSRQKGMFGNAPSTFTFTGTEFIKSFKGSNSWNTSVNVDISDSTLNGRAARRITMQAENTREATNLTLLVDASTDLPIEGQTHVRAQNGIELRSVMSFDFNQRLAANLFEPKFPASARLVDLDKGREEWRQKLAKGIARRKVGQRTIVIRDIQVNAEGHVFLLYTAGRKFYGEKFREFDKQGLADVSDWDVQLADDRGTQYVKTGAQFQPTMEGFAPSENLIYNGEKLEGEWWIPLQPQSRPWQPRRFTVTFRINPRAWHPVKASSIASSIVSNSQTYLSTSFDFAVQRPESALLPDYMPYMIGIAVTPRRLREQEADARGLLPPGVEESPQLVRSLQAGTDSVSSVAFSPDGRVLASATWNSGVKLWDVPRGKLRKAIGSSKGFVPSPIFTTDGRTLVSVSITDDKQENTKGPLRVRNIETGETLPPTVLPRQRGLLGTMAFSPDEKTLTSCGTLVTEAKKQDGINYVSQMSAQIRTWDAQSGKMLQTRLIPQGGFVLNIALLPDGKIVTSTQRVKNGINLGSLIRLFDAASGQEERTFLAPEEVFEARTFAVSPDGKALACGGTNYTNDGRANINRGTHIYLWNVQTGELLQTMKSGGQWLNKVAFSPDGKLLASANASADKMAEVWDVQSGNQLHVFTGHGRRVQEVAFSPDSRTLASGDSAGIVKLWRVR